jgi:hypothetical protein
VREPFPEVEKGVRDRGLLPLKAKLFTKPGVFLQLFRKELVSLTEKFDLGKAVLRGLELYMM